MSNTREPEGKNTIKEFKSTYINAKQSPQMRRAKHRFIKDAGFSTAEAEKMKDWTHRHIVQYMWANKEKVRTKYPK